MKNILFILFGFTFLFANQSQQLPINERLQNSTFSIIKENKEQSYSFSNEKGYREDIVNVMKNSLCENSESEYLDNKFIYNYIDIKDGFVEVKTLISCGDNPKMVKEKVVDNKVIIHIRNSVYHIYYGAKKEDQKILLKKSKEIVCKTLYNGNPHIFAYIHENDISFIYIDQCN